MRRSWRFRLFALLFAPWLATVAAEATGIHDCPVHGSHAAHAHQMAHVPAGMAHDQSAPSPGNNSQHSCTCLGCCCASSGAALPRFIDVALVLPLRSSDQRVATFTTASVPKVNHLLPFATAPPTAL